MQEIQFPQQLLIKKIIEKYDKGIKEGEFYEEPIGGDFNYPDW